MPNKKWLTDLKPGDRVTRMMSSAKIPMVMVVRDVTDDVITADMLQSDGGVVEGGWTFCRHTGIEIDDYLGWGPKFGVTGSTLEETHAH